MGLDLTLVPFDSYSGESMHFSHTVLICKRRSALFESILAIPKQHIVPKTFMSDASQDDAYEEPHYGTTPESPDREGLTYVFAQDLVALANHAGVKDSWKNQAIWAYLGCLPPDCKVALYWS